MKQNVMWKHRNTESLEFVYHHNVENNFHELLCDYEHLKSRVPLLTNAYAHTTKLKNGTKYHISLAQGWLLEEDDARPEKPDDSWNYDEQVHYKLSLRERLDNLSKKWAVERELIIPRIRVSNGGTYEFHNPAQGPQTSDDLAELAEFIRDAYKTTKQGVAPHISFD